MPKGITLEKLTFGDILSVAENIVSNHDQLKVNFILNFYTNEVYIKRFKFFMLLKM